MESGFGDNDVNSTSNGFMLPVATVITCGTGSFGDDSLIESFIRAGTPSTPKDLLYALVQQPWGHIQCCLII